jgi:hypothetical protein
MLKIKLMFISYSKPSKDTMAEYVRRIMFLKGIIETHKLVSQLCDICVQKYFIHCMITSFLQQQLHD